jgi:hypothetical protein
MDAWMNWQNGGKRQLLFWHRRAGKDELNLNMHAVSSAQRVGTYWHMLPLATQARKAIWTAVNPNTGKRRIFDAFPQSYIENMNDNEMFIRFKSGSTFQVVGSDNFNSLVGSPPIGITFSEWALANPSAWAYLSPILAENGGWASFITTPRGNNHAKGMYDAVKNNPAWFCQILTANDTGAISDAAIEEQREVYAGIFGKDIADALINQEFYCSFSGAMVGAYFGAEMSKAERDGRMRVVPITEGYPVHTAWDLGATHNNPIWCFQVIGSQLRIVDFYLPESDDLEDWCAWLNGKGYNGNDYVPHDILVTEWGSKRTRIETLRALGRKPRRIAKVSVADGLQAGRVAINSAVFHDADDERGKRIAHGIDGLKSYRRDWDDERKTFRETPVKDWAEHLGSAWRYLALSWREESTSAPKEKPKELEFIAKADGTVVGNMSVRDAVEAMVRRKRGRT